MNEATFQAFATHSMKFVCSELNKKMRLYVPSSNQQSPVDGDGYPYDVGVLLDNAYLVGIEFKVCDGGRFPSWRKDQHDTYVGLTGGAHIELPLYYAYNALDGTQLDKLYEDDQFVPLLEGTNVSTPKDLPGQPPAIEAHENMYDWLIAILSDPGRCERNGWTTISTQNAWDPKSGKSTILEDVLQGFPDIIWLLVTVHNGLRVSWALTSTEMREHVENLRAIWRQKELRTVSTANTKQAYLALMEENSNYIRSVWADLKNQQANADDMGDKPDNDGFKPF
ncbi:hypothetical protein [Janthinobacterium sp.]|uniref:hypothetical protein n=1 Tax=Janthinobacterium sp. TaxID=1871054 RepID=UPI00260A4848|nr:hypothetical protein [Janthinobacterium sp.]